MKVYRLGFVVLLLASILPASAQIRETYHGLLTRQVTGTFNALTPANRVNSRQTFQTGTHLLIALTTTRYSTTSRFYFLNPYYDSVLNLQFTQPLRRNRWRFENRAPVLIARKSLQQSSANFEAQVSDALLNAVSQYWAVVLARGNVDVTQKALEAAEATYQHDTRALERGAL